MQSVVSLVALAVAVPLGVLAWRSVSRGLRSRPRALGALARGAVLAGITAFVALQAVPYGRDHENPSTRVEPQWDSAGTRELAVRACFDCHSNETAWPWYSNVAPVSWLVAHDVEEGRATLNLSEFDRQQRKADEAAEAVREGEMPPGQFLITHPEARLTADEQSALAAGLAATLGERRRGG